MADVTPWEGAPWDPRAWQRAALPEIREAVRQRVEGRFARPIVSATMGAGKSILLAEVVWLAMTRAREGESVVVTTPTQALVRQLSATISARVGKANVGQFYGRKKQAGRQVVVTCNPSVGALRCELAALGRRVRLLIADEVHQTEGPEIKAAIEALSPSGALGFTATPYRSEQSERLELWDSIAYRYTMGDALRDRVLVPWRTVNWSGDGDADTDSVCLRLIREHGDGPGIVSALTTDDADAYAEVLVGGGVPAASIHSKLSRKEQDARIEALRAGGLRALVHVNMLSEGVDFPWLRWLCMRRPVGARVRFAQEMGRVLRVDSSDPTKERAIIIDPHDLFGTFGLSAEPAIGPAGEVEDPMPEEGEGRVGRGLPEEVCLPPAKAIGVTTQWARSLLMALQAHGIASSDSVDGARWRTRRPSDSQIRALERLRWATRYMPKEHRAVVKHLCEPGVARRLQRGAVSDLISVLHAVADASADARKARKHWPWPAGLAVEPLESAALVGLREAA